MYLVVELSDGQLLSTILFHNKERATEHFATVCKENDIKVQYEQNGGEVAYDPDCVAGGYSAEWFTIEPADKE